MKRAWIVLTIFALFSGALATEKHAREQWNGLGVVRNAHRVYVTSYDGPQLSAYLTPEDRTAIGSVQKAMEERGYFVVNSPADADMILAVQARHSSDLLAVYDARRPENGIYLWRGEAKKGLSGPNPMLVQQLERAMERAGAGS